MVGATSSEGQSTVCYFLAASRLSMTLNVEAYEYTPLAQHGVGLRLYVDEMPHPRQYVVPGSDGGVVLAPGTRAQLTLQRHRRVISDVTDDVGNIIAVYICLWLSQ